MKTIVHHKKEFLAWIVLVCALALFSVSVSFAQNKKEDHKSEIKIKIQKDENGKKTKLDTTITSDQLPALKEYLKDLDIDFDADMHSGKSGGNMRMHFKHPEMSDRDRKALKKEMEGLRKELDGLGDEMKDLHIEMHGFNDDDPENFDLRMNMPGFPCLPMPPSGSNRFYFYGDSDSSGTGSKNFHFRFHSMSDDVPDSLNDDEHIVVYGSKGEGKPELEKEIITKDGEKIFIFKRKLPKEEKEKATPSMPLTKLKAYPNPGGGLITVSFTAVSKGDVQISISDMKGNEVYSKSLKSFSGEYSSQINLSDKGKGNYFLKITQGDDSITKKLVVE